MDNSNYYNFMRVGDLKTMIRNLPDEMAIVIPVIDEDDVNHISGFRKVRTAGILGCQWESEQKVLCFNGATNGQDIADQIHFSGKDVDVLSVLYAKTEDDEKKEKKNDRK